MGRASLAACRSHLETGSPAGRRTSMPRRCRGSSRRLDLEQVQLYHLRVLVVVDTSVLVAVLASEPQRSVLVRLTEGADLVAPASVHWEVGNALSAFLKRRRATLREVQLCLVAYAAIPLRLVDVDLALALEISAEHGLSAYDAYLVVCALAQRAPLLTLDRGLRRAASDCGVEILEVPT